MVSGQFAARFGFIRQGITRRKPVAFVARHFRLSGGAALAGVPPRVQLDLLVPELHRPLQSLGACLQSLFGELEWHGARTADLRDLYGGHHVAKTALPD